MFLLVVLGSAAVIATPALLWWALSGERTPAVVSRNLTSGMAGTVDMRADLLSRSVGDRTVAPAVELPLT